MKKLILLFICILFVCGCEEVYLRNPFSMKPPIVVHLMTPDDYFVIPADAWVEWDDMNDLDGKDFAGDRIYIKKWGSFYSNDAQSRIMQAKVEQ